MELQSTEKHGGITSPPAQEVWHLLKFMLTAQWSSAHECDLRECAHCEARVMWYQLVLELVTMINPEETAHPPDVSNRHFISNRGFIFHFQIFNVWLYEFLNR